jgi:hypothetical protein
VQGLSALFLALRRRPVIRYQRGSGAAQKLAEGLYGLTYKQQVGGVGGCGDGGEFVGTRGGGKQRLVVGVTPCAMACC